MRILYHHRTQAEDAQGIHISEMVKAFRSLGHTVEVTSLVSTEQPIPEKSYGSHWKRMRELAPHWAYDLMTLAYNAYGYRALCRRIRSFRPDFIYERYSLNTFCGILASRRFGVPIVLEVNAPLAYEQDMLGNLAFKRVARFSERWICSHATKTLVVSHVMKDFLVHEGVPSGHMIVMPNGIDPDTFHPAVSGKTVRVRYGLDGQVVIGVVGWFRPWHGAELLLQAFHRANLASRGARLLLVGDGPACPDLQRFVERRNLSSVVVFTGPVPRKDIPGHIAAMDIAVQPSATGYACPMKIFEYMGMARCIVSPDQPNIREILQDRVTGFLFRPSDTESLQRTLTELLNQPAKRNAAGQKAYARIFEKGYLWQANAQRTVAVIFGDPGHLRLGYSLARTATSTITSQNDLDDPLNVGS